ncbi:MAG: M6 family metalloprotease domain-containing protein [Candidatus Helarchaeota archaeon]
MTEPGPNMPLDLISEYTPPGEPVYGTDEAIIIMVDFSDQVGSNTKTFYESMLFGGIDGSLNDYYSEISYNKFTLSGEVAGNGWYRSSHTMVYYGADDVSGHDNLNGPIYELAREAAILADDDVDFSQYDKDGDGVVDHLIFVHAGDSQATSGVANDIWSHRWNIYGTPLYLDGVRLYGYTMQAETDNMGTYAHEMGHDIGLPDLYDGDYVETYVRYWGLMASGAHNDGGNHPSHMMAWSKMQLGWIDSSKIVTVDDGEWRNVILDPLELTSGTIQVIKLSITTSTYILIENRQQIGYDQYLPDEGVIITYVDDTLGTYEGIVRIQDSRPSSIAYPNDLNDAEFSSETGNVVIYRNSTYNIIITICSKIGNSYKVLVDRYYPPKSYTNYNFQAGYDTWYTFSDKTAGQVIYWDWYCTNPAQNIDFWIKKNDSSGLYEEVYNVNSDGGTFRIPEDGTWEIHFRNDLGVAVSVDHYMICWTAPNIEIFTFYENPITIYEGEDFDLYLQVYNAGGSQVEGATANITLPIGLTVNNPITEIGNLDWGEYKTISWRVHADSAGSYLVFLSLTSIWGGSEMDIENVLISTDDINPSISIITPSDGYNSENTELIVEWTSSDAQTGIDYYWLVLDSNPQIVLYNTSYVLRGLSQGSHTVQIVAYDKSGRSNSDSITITIDYSNPSTAQVTSISNNDICYGGVLITANALDSYTDISRVEFWDGIPGSGTLIYVDINGSNGWGFIWNTTTSDNGDHVIYIRVFDELGHYLDSSGISIVISNQATPPNSSFDILDLILIVGILSGGVLAGIFSILWIKEKNVYKKSKKESLKGMSSKKIEKSKYESIPESKLKESSEISKKSETINKIPTTFVSSPKIVEETPIASENADSFKENKPDISLLQQIQAEKVSNLLELVLNYKLDLSASLGSSHSYIGILDEWIKKLEQYPLTKLTPSDSELLAHLIESLDKILS